MIMPVAVCRARVRIIVFIGFERVAIVAADSVCCSYPEEAVLILGDRLDAALRKSVVDRIGNKGTHSLSKAGL